MPVARYSGALAAWPAPEQQSDPTSGKLNHHVDKISVALHWDLSESLVRVCKEKQDPLWLTRTELGKVKINTDNI